MITIKKYGNRRLYDTSRSSYINLDQLAELVQSGQTVQVLDARTGEDLTREVLLQVVMEVLQGSDLFTPDMLHRIIRSTGSNPWNRVIYQQLVAGLQMISSQLDQAERVINFGGGPFGMGAQPPSAQPQRPTAPPTSEPPVEPLPPPEPPPDVGPELPSPNQELDDLRARLADLERRMRG